ncbi:MULTISPECIES: LytR/AlgR family response regulator transcription factor [Chryseobacterium]|uniref:Two-component system response regulator LytT n=1 Tax=Chryseobacterium camelliae TaxID=1265445 RepID=A0ABU0TCS1_9FLAO|nr:MULTISPECIES: LytTR family DNA-binding domain-containing protein [Chryseobacterium]MDT3407337.1 two-component system response regulator LytT [Pseudacidovorax intermedius]MDQ1094874.1 two-component system response regulator LytT [Chryseobacterium camelliae]MDQ1098814.1 two-component system response regulator LytT [Chryseobacterium sp. SORGH_AS_1048]MDR6086165.1 two-component system response regulator LytT [Chryseobacterium sp. SORGH_AS_0909]MDR6130535.1 two-component system response regulato
MIKAIALDDEILALKIIENYAGKIENLSLEKTFNIPSEAQKHLNKYPVDLIFLDIEMPSKNGMELFKSISQNTKVIFTTAYSEYAVDAFNINAVDYLLKPFSFERFRAAVDKVKPGHESDDLKYLSIRADYKLYKINFDDILLIEGLDDYIQIHLTDHSRITARSSMKNILEKLSDKDFVRVHRSYIIPVNAIRTIVNRNIHIGNFIIPIGETYKEAVMKIVNK